MPFQTSYDAPNFFGGLSAIGQTLKQSQLESNRQAAFAGMQSGVPLSDISKALLGAGDTQAGLAVAQLAEAHAQHAATQDIAKQTLALHQQMASPEYLARTEEQKAQIAQKYAPPIAVAPGTTLIPRPGPGQTQENIKPIFQSQEGLLSQDAIDMKAAQLNSGDTSALSGMGYGSMAGMNRSAIVKRAAELAKEQGVSGEQMAQRTAGFQGTKSEARVTGTRAAQLSIPMQAFESQMPLALEASQSVDRTRYPTLNSIALAVKQGTGDESVVALNTALTTLANQYARAVTPSGQSTDASRAKAYGLFEAAYSKGQLATAIDFAHREMLAEKQAIGQVKQEQAGPKGAPAKQFPAPSPEAIQMFRNNSAKRGEAQKFEEAFGPGSAAQALRGQ